MLSTLEPRRLLSICTDILKCVNCRKSLNFESSFDMGYGVTRCPFWYTGLFKDSLWLRREKIETLWGSHSSVGSWLLCEFGQTAVPLWVVVSLSIEQELTESRLGLEE